MRFVYLTIGLIGFTLVTQAAPPALPDFTKEQRVELGRKHKTAEALFNALRDQSKGGQKLAWNALPDWTGIYSRHLKSGLAFDPDQPPGGNPTAKLTPEYQEKVTKRIQ